jgi:hypothetical protein
MDGLGQREQPVEGGLVFHHDALTSWKLHARECMAFDRKQYGMNSGIPFIKIADRVEVTLDLKGKRVSGPPVNLK